jgi:hypothetical protein
MELTLVNIWAETAPMDPTAGLREKFDDAVLQVVNANPGMQLRAALGENPMYTSLYYRINRIHSWVVASASFTRADAHAKLVASIHGFIDANGLRTDAYNANNITIEFQKTKWEIDDLVEARDKILELDQAWDSSLLELDDLVSLPEYLFFPLLAFMSKRGEIRIRRP